MNNIITIRQFVTILQQKGFMAEQPNNCEAVVFSFFHTIAETLKTDDIVSIDGLGDFTIVNRESGLIIFIPDPTLADVVNEPFAFFEPTEISEVVTDEMLEVPTTEMPKEIIQDEVKEFKAVEDTKKPEGPVKADPQDRNAYVISVPKTENSYHEQTSVSQPGSFTETPDPKTIEREQELKREQELRRELERELELRREMEMRREQELRKEQEPVEKEEDELIKENEECHSDFYPEQDIDKDDETEEESESTEEIEDEESETMGPRESKGHSTLTLVAIAILALAIGFVTGLFSAEHLFAGEDEDIGYQSNVAEQIELLRSELFSPEDTMRQESTDKSVENISNDSDDVEQNVTEEYISEAMVEEEPIVITDTIKENYYLTHMSRKYYGGVMEFWVYIYLENQNNLGNPTKVKPNTVVVIPPVEKYGIDPNSKKSIALAKQIANEINSKYK